VGVFDRVSLGICAVSLTLLALAFLLASLGWHVPVLLIQTIIESPNGRAMVGVVSAILFVAGIRFIYYGFKGSPIQAVVHDSELGEVRISLTAVKNLVSRVASRTSGVREVRSEVRLGEGGSGIIVYLQLKVAVDANLPDLADKLQKAVSSYVRDIVGVSVESVKVSVSDIALETRR
jgi:uncharacterized alkaline shock family protein YloU